MMSKNIAIARGGELSFLISKIIKLSFSFLFDALKQKFIGTLRNHSVNTI